PRLYSDVPDGQSIATYSTIPRTIHAAPTTNTCQTLRRCQYTLQLHDFLFLRLRNVVDGGDVLVGQLLDLLLAVLALVFGDVAVLFGFLDHVHRVAPRRAHRHARLLGLLADDLRELLAALLRERRNRQPHELAVGDRVDPEVARADRLVDHRDHRLLPRLDRDQARVDDLHRRDLIHRRRRAVVVHLDAVEHRRVRAAGADLLQIALERVDGLLHAVFSILRDVVDHGCLRFIRTESAG